MGNNKNISKGNSKVSPRATNDQLGENASEEFAQDYDNKSKYIANNPKGKSNK
jgi:hypothetical protein